MTLMTLEETGGAANKVEDLLKTMVVYSDRAAASKVLTVQQRVLQQFVPGCPVRTAWWAMESLKDEVLFETSSRHAAEVDLLFIALTVSGELPQKIKAWLATVLTRNSRPDLALVVLLGTANNPPAEVNLLDNYLHEQSRHAGIDCFIYWHQQMSSSETSFLADVRHILADAPDCSCVPADRGGGEPRWGINE